MTHEGVQKTACNEGEIQRQTTINKIFGMHGERGIQGDEHLAMKHLKKEEKGLLWINNNPRQFVLELVDSEPLDYCVYGSIEELLADHWVVS